jgi:hypothetical protein
VSELKYYDIRNVNDLEMNGIKEYVGASSDISVKNAINDIFIFLTQELGLTYIQTNGDLDLQNIPDLNIATHASQYNTLNTGESLTYGFHIFAFNDEFQDTKPLFLRFNYNMINAILKYDIASCKNFLIFYIKLDILSKSSPTSNYNQIFTTDLCNIVYNIYDWNSNVSHANAAKINFINKPSYGFYNPEKSKLYINIYPKKSCIGSIYYNSSTYMHNSSYISFYLERNQNFITFINLSNGISTDYYYYGINITTSSVQRSLQTFNYNGISFSSNDGFFIPYISEIPTNYSNSVWKTTLINPFTKYISTTDNILSYYNNQLATSGIITQIDNVGTYVSYSCSDQICYARYTNVGLLLRID